MKILLSLVVVAAFAGQCHSSEQSILESEIKEMKWGLHAGEIPKDGGLLGLGGLYEKLGDQKEAHKQYEEQMEQFPVSEFSKQADYRLKKMDDRLPPNPCEDSTPEARAYVATALAYDYGQGAGAGLPVKRRRLIAAEYYEKALYISPHYEPAIRSLILIYLELDAKANLDRVVELKKQHIACQQDPDNYVSLKISLPGLYQAQGKAAEALAIRNELKKEYPRNYFLADVSEIPLGSPSLGNAGYNKIRDEATPILEYLRKTHIEGQYYDHFAVYQALVNSHGETGDEKYACDLANEYVGRYQGETDRNVDTAENWQENFCHQKSKDTETPKIGDPVQYLEDLKTEPTYEPSLTIDFFNLLKQVGKAGRWDLVFYHCRIIQNSYTRDSLDGPISFIYPLVVSALRSGDIKPARQPVPLQPAWMMAVPNRKIVMTNISDPGEKKLLIRIPIPASLPLKTLSYAVLNLYPQDSNPYRLFAYRLLKPGGDIDKSRVVAVRRGNPSPLQSFDLTEWMRSSENEKNLDLCIVEKPVGPDKYPVFALDKDAPGNQLVMIFRSAEKPDASGVLSVQESPGSLFEEGLRRIEAGDFINAQMCWKRIPETCERCKVNITECVKLIGDHLAGRPLYDPGYPWPGEEASESFSKAQVNTMASVYEHYALVREYLKLFWLRIERIWKK